MSGIKRLSVAMLFIFAALLSACASSGQTGTDGDEDTPTGLDICDTCKSGEACIGPSGGTADPFCARVCENELDCPNEDDCCLALDPGQDAQRYCLPALYCNCPDCCVTCTSHSVCRALGYTRCDFEANCCTYESADGDTSDGDIPDGDRPDGDADGDGSAVNCDTYGPYLAMKPTCDFGAVDKGVEGTCTVTITNEGPGKTACIQYRVAQSEPEEFRLAEESDLREGDSVCIAVGKSIDVTMKYQWVDDDIPDLASLEVFLPKETDDGAIIPCHEYVELLTQVKGTPNLYTDPEPPSILDFGQVRVGGSEGSGGLKALPLLIGNRRVDPAANAPLQVNQIRFEDTIDWHFSVNTDNVPAGGLKIPQDTSTNLLIQAHPRAEGLLTNTLHFASNDPRKPTVAIDVQVEGVVPRVCAYPFPVIFGDVSFSSGEYREVEICNCGGYELSVEDLSIVGDTTLSFELIDEYAAARAQNPQILPPEGEGTPGSDCFTIEVGCAPSRRGNLQASLRVESDSTGSPIYDIPLSCNGVGPTLCSAPASPVDFGAVRYDPGNPPTVPPKQIQVWNCGPGTATVKGLGIRMGSNTAAGTFTLGNFQPNEPTVGNSIPLLGGSNPNYLIFDLGYVPPAHGEHRAIISVDAEAQGHELDIFIEVKATATDCAPNTWDLDPETEGCEYYCVFQDGTDNPDMEFIDSNCDGIDGMVDQAVFVSYRDGNDNNPGTLESPKKNLSTALFTAAIEGKPHVYASADTYPGRLVVRDGISIYGGYNRLSKDNTAPRGWKRSLSHFVIINGDNIGMNASQISAPTTLQLLTVNAYGSSQDDLSNYGVYSYFANALVMEYITINVGSGRNGQIGSSPGEIGKIGDRGETGQSGREDDGSWYCAANGRPGIGLGGPSPCGMHGGVGGSSCKTSSSSGCAGFSGADGVGGAAGGTGVVRGSGRNGTAGEGGADGSNGAGGTWVGTVRNGRWYPNNGTAGGSGGNGGGGGGGAGGGSVYGGWLTCDDWGGTGGGGGGGGCGGTGGAGGEGGGSSFGVFLYESSPELRHITIVTGDGGDGAAGRPGGQGGKGGNGGDGGMHYDSGSDGGKGGAGGQGGRGGAGGGGSGGNSIGLFISGNSSPFYEELDITLGLKGFGGGTGVTKGENGREYEIYPVPTR